MRQSLISECSKTNPYNPLKGRGCQLVTLCHPGLTYVFYLWHSGTLAASLALSPECQSAQMSEIKNVGYTWMAMNNCKCNHLKPLHFRGLKCRNCTNFTNLLLFQSFTPEYLIVSTHRHEDLCRFSQAQNNYLTLSGFRREIIICTKTNSANK